MTDDDEGLVLDSRPYRERHLLLTVLTPHRGPLRGVLRGARGGKAPAAAAAQLLSLVRVSTYVAPNAELATFRRLDLVESSFPLAADLGRFAAAAVVAELLAAYCPPEVPAPKPFRLGRAALEALLGEVPPEVVVAYVELWTLALGGVLPTLDRCAACEEVLGAPIAVAGVDGLPHCERCAPADAIRLRAADLEFLERCRTLPMTGIGAAAPPAASRWLDRMVRATAERRLHALEFFHRHGTHQR